MNAILTWWAVSLALLEHAQLGNEILARETLLRSVPIFVAILVWLLRVLLIGTFSLSMQPEHSTVEPIKGRPGNPSSNGGHAVPPSRVPESERAPRPIRPAPKPAPAASMEMEYQPAVARSHGMRQ
jgi:hypothetical protein